jgi:BirA family transcriptional regulator, biotin operon repressor / biotin---[acetyl-CoA-carboxylase] ligase
METTSTNTYASNMLLAEKPGEGTVIITHSQKCGKGQQGNTWESEPGKNLTVSVILYPSMLSPEKQFYLNKFVSLAVLDFVRLHIPDSMSPKIKWPNDIYVGHNKIGGILIENTIMSQSITHSIIGIGININQEKFTRNVPNPISLKSATGKDFDIDICLEELCVALNERYDQLRSGKNNILDSDYLKNIFRLDQFSKFKINNTVVSARITGISEYGKLMICNEKGNSSEYAFKEIEYLI